MKHSLLKKLFLFSISFILSFGFLELSLRTIGYFVQLNVEKEYIPLIDESNNQDNDYTIEKFNNPIATNSIMCIGDSFTNGGNVQSYDTYPFFLFNNLNNNHHIKYNVLNFGKCESSTFDTENRIYEKINSLIDSKKELPKYILILTGSADLFNYNFGSIRDINLTEKDVNVYSLFTKFRIYKMYRIIKYELLKYLNITSLIRLPNDNVDSTSLGHIEEAFNLTLKHFLPTDVFSEKSYSLKDPFFKKMFQDYSMKGLSKEIIKEVFPEEKIPSHVYIERLIIYRLAIFSRSNDHISGINFILQFIKKYPNFFWKNNNVKAVKYYLTQNIRLQSEISPQSFQQKILNTSITTDDYNKFLDFLKNWNINEDNINKLRYESWSRIITFLQQHNITPILQTYPSNYISANNVLRNVSHTYSLNLVDHNDIFQDLFKKEPKSKYLFDDDHCTPAGYKLMADNIYKLISNL